jgi:hypothetical protein
VPKFEREMPLNKPEGEHYNITTQHTQAITSHCMWKAKTEESDIRGH